MNQRNSLSTKRRPQDFLDARHQAEHRLMPVNRLAFSSSR
jgi:hypothetical protein